MTVAIALLAYAACAGTLGSRLLNQARWTHRAPLLAIVTYLATAWSVVAAAALAGLTLAVHATTLGSGLSQLIGACVIRLRDTYATPGGALVACLGLALAAAVTARTAVAAATHLRAVRRHARQHAQAVRLVGRPEPALDAMLVEHPQPAAYCVAGPDPTVIVTTAALQALDRDQLAAVLAHERAHLAWHHHRLVALARIARQLLPFLPLMREAAVQVARLVEMHADDTNPADAPPGRAAGPPAAAAAAGRGGRPRADPAPARADPGRGRAGPRPGPGRLAAMPRRATAVSVSQFIANH